MDDLIYYISTKVYDYWFCACTVQLYYSLPFQVQWHRSLCVCIFHLLVFQIFWCHSSADIIQQKRLGILGSYIIALSTNSTELNWERSVRGHNETECRKYRRMMYANIDVILIINLSLSKTRKSHLLKRMQWDRFHRNQFENETWLHISGLCFICE